MLSIISSLFIRFLFFGITQMILVIGSFQYWSKRKTRDSQFLLIGSVVITLVYFFNIVFFHFFTGNEDFMYEIISIGSTILSFLGSLSFAIGFYILIQKYLGKKHEEDANEVDKIGRK